LLVEVMDLTEFVVLRRWFDKQEWDSSTSKRKSKRSWCQI